MNCLEFRQLLDEHLDGALGAESEAACLSHLRACLGCTHLRADALEVLRALRELPAAVPEAGFAERVLAGVRAAQSAPMEQSFLREWGSIGALAASVTAAVALGAWNPDDAVPNAVAGGSEPVRLVFHSESPVSGVTFELQLPEGVELSGYPGQRRLVWQSDLRSGDNLLELPVQPGGAGGVVTATLNLGGERRQFSVRVVPTSAPAAPVSAARAAMQETMLVTVAKCEVRSDFRVENQTRPQISLVATSREVRRHV